MRLFVVGCCVLIGVCCLCVESCLPCVRWLLLRGALCVVRCLSFVVCCCVASCQNRVVS